MALRKGGLKTGKEDGERPSDRGLWEDEPVKRVLYLLEHFWIGKVTADENHKDEQELQEPLDQGSSIRGNSTGGMSLYASSQLASLMGSSQLSRIKTLGR